MKNESLIGHLEANFEERRVGTAKDWRTDLEPDPAAIWGALVDGAPGVVTVGEVTAGGRFHIYRRDDDKGRKHYRVCDCACASA
jgi:hypothetical protein